MLSKIFSEAIRARVTDTNPCHEVRLLQVNNRRTRYLTDEEEPTIHAQLAGTLAHLRDVVIVVTGSGMRLGDLFNLRKTAVDFQGNFVWAANAKKGKP